MKVETMDGLADVLLNAGWKPGGITSGLIMAPGGNPSVVIERDDPHWRATVQVGVEGADPTWLKMETYDPDQALRVLVATGAVVTLTYQIRTS